MAIVFQSTSISGASAAVSGATAQSAIRDALVNHPSGAWTLVEEFDSAGASVHWVVLKNSTAISGVGSDFFVCIGRLVSTGQLCVMVGEIYTAPTHNLNTFAPISGTSTNTILPDGSFSAGTGPGSPSSYVLGAALPTNASANPFAPTNTPAATMRFVPIVEKDYAIVSINTNTFYVGALTDLIVPAPGLVAAIPIGCFDLFSSNNVGSLTRHPIDAAIAPLQVASSHGIQPINSGLLAAIQRQALDTGIYLNSDRYQGNRVAASELAAIMIGSNVNTGPNNTAVKLGGIRGKFKNVRVTTYPIAAVVFDTIVVDGRKHIILLDKGSISGEFLTPVNYNTTVKYGFVCDTGVAA